MHIQARAHTAKSPPDLLEFLRVFDRDDEHGGPINIEGVSGARVEGGGFLCFTVEHGRVRNAHARLTAESYRVQWTRAIHKERIPPLAGSGAALAADDPNQPGVLAGIIERAKGSQVAEGRAIDCVLIGARTGEPGVFYAQVTFVGDPWSDVPNDDDDNVDD
jgi:hypothetical protein